MVEFCISSCGVERSVAIGSEYGFGASSVNL